MTDQLRIFAGLQGFVSAAGLLALILFFALATPYGAEQRRWAWFGPVNDWLYVLGAAPWIIASVLLVVRVRGGAVLWVLTGILCILIAAGAIVTALMLAGRVGLTVQFLVATPMILVGFIWLWPATSRGIRGGGADMDPPVQHRRPARVRGGRGDGRRRLPAAGGLGAADGPVHSGRHPDRTRDDRVPRVVDHPRVERPLTPFVER
jgi:hypothetical protein